MMDMKKYAKKIFDIQIEELLKVKDNIGDEIGEAVDLINSSKGKVVVTGIGKSGLIGKKISATLASTGTYSTFMNSAEGLHGDLGMIHPEDVVVAISNSGNSDEVVNIIPSIKKIGAKIIAMTGNDNSKLGKASDIVLNIGVTRECCPMNLAPTCSTTATLVIGDILATLLIERKKFKPENFAVYHPGGSLGRKLLTRVKDLLLKDIKLLSADSSIKKIILEMSNQKLGVVCIGKDERLEGIITEGDIRRALSLENKFFNLKAHEIMTKDYILIPQDILAVDALAIMEEREIPISVLPVIEEKKFKGIVRVHDLIKIR